MNVINKNFIEPEQDYERCVKNHLEKIEMTYPIRTTKDWTTTSTECPDVSAKGNSLDNLIDNLKKNLKNHTPFRKKIDGKFKLIVANPKKKN